MLASAAAMTGGTASLLSLLLLGFPLLGAVLNGLVGKQLGRRFVNLVGTLSILGAFVVTCVVLSCLLGADAESRSVTSVLWNWIDLGGSNLRVDLSVTLDQLSTVMLLVITGVGFLIHVYATGYMEHDESPHRFFSYMNFFVFSMVLLVLAANLAFLIIGWALVAVSSYLLIGYYYDRPSAVLAARKAFITQVIGDLALVIAAFLLVVNLKGGNGLSLPDIFAHASGSFSTGGGMITAICLLLAVGAFAKSAQFPLHTWLPDAMEGPTPVSALIHAATMVTAGVYLIARFHHLFDMSPVAQAVVATVGMGTALMAGIIAISQIDIKRVIAYSTMSQIGLMIFAVGLGAYNAAMYHFVTHAIFKALLFMTAGNVIHALHDEQDIRLMGGLAGKMRGTAWCFLVGSLALGGIPIWAGFFSKEDLLGFGLASGSVSYAPVLYAVGLLVNVLTGVYAFRLYWIVFHGEPQTARVYAAHEAPKSMLWPCLVLAAGATIAGLVLQWPIPNAPVHVFSSWLEPVFTGSLAEPPTTTAAIGVFAGLIASLLGLGIAAALWQRRDQSAWSVANRTPRVLAQLSFHRFYFDELYDAVLVRPTRSLATFARDVVEPRVVDGAVNGVAGFARSIGDVLREWQTGLIRDYALTFVLGIAVVVLFLSTVISTWVHQYGTALAGGFAVLVVAMLALSLRST